MTNSADAPAGPVFVLRVPPFPLHFEGRTRPFPTIPARSWLASRKAPRALGGSSCGNRAAIPVGGELYLKRLGGSGH